eukprot:COSAG06_NODE_66438_length_254_cov_0.774194_1_plen_48_part_01
MSAVTVTIALDAPAADDERRLFDFLPPLLLDLLAVDATDCRRLRADFS